MVEGSSLTKDSVMTLHCAFIGFGKSTTRYHLPYVLHRKDRWQVAHVYRRRAKPEEQAPQYSHIHFTSDLDEVLNDPLVKLVVVCTHADSHFEYAKKALEAGKNVLVEKPFTPTLEEAKTLFALANSKGLTVTPYQNLRFDSCFLTTKKVIESGKLGELVEIESHFDNYRPLASSMALACIPWIRSFRCSAARTMSLTICARCAIKPTRMTPLKPSCSTAI